MQSYTKAKAGHCHIHVKTAHTLENGLCSERVKKMKLTITALVRPRTSDRSVGTMKMKKVKYMDPFCSVRRHDLDGLLMLMI